MHIYELDKIKQLIPHRFENLLIDQLERLVHHDEFDSKLRLTINHDDSLSRSIFFKKTSLLNPVLLTPLMMEVLALGGVITGGGVPSGCLVFFVGISNFIFQQDVVMGEPVYGYIKSLSSKSGFIRYRGVLKNKNNHDLNFKPNPRLNIK